MEKKEFIEQLAKLFTQLEKEEGIMAHDTVDQINKLVDKFKNTHVTKDVNRVEVIDQQGRSYVNKGDSLTSVELKLQDNGKTLKVFIATQI